MFVSHEFDKARITNHNFIHWQCMNLCYERQWRILCKSSFLVNADNVQFLPDCSNLSSIKSSPIMAPANRRVTTTFHRLDCPAQRDWRDLVHWAPGHSSAQTLDTSNPLVRNGRRKYTNTATTAPRIIILVVAGIPPWAAPSLAGAGLSGSAWVEESGSGSSFSFLYFVLSLITLKTGSQTYHNINY